MNQLDQSPLVQSWTKNPTQYKNYLKHDRLFDQYSVHCFVVVRGGV